MSPIHQLNSVSSGVVKLAVETKLMEAKIEAYVLDRRGRVAFLDLATVTNVSDPMIRSGVRKSIS